MNRIAIIAAALAVTVSAGAQDMYYAKMLSGTNYYGTARSMALGNAVTALGGDLGTIGINPAGSAVAPYGQFTITPGLNFSVVSTGYDVNGSCSYEKERHGKFALPNIGASFVMDTGNDWGLRTIVFGFTANTVNSYLGYSTAFGTNDRNCMLGNFANAAYGFTHDELSNSDSAPWDLYASYAANQILPYGTSGEYAGNNQVIGDGDGYCYLPGKLNQTSTHDEFGHRTDIVMNMGFNVCDRFFFGFNLGIPTLSYSRQDWFRESAQDPDLFPITFHNDVSNLDEVTNFRSASNTFKLVTSGDGIYAKFGVLGIPVEGLRIGAAIQTPTAMTIYERWINTAECSYTNAKYDGYGRSPEGEYQYNLRTPWSVNAGIAYTFAGTGLVSLDYEMNDYSSIRYSDVQADEFSDDTFREENIVNKKFLGASHSIRAGLEYKFMGAFAVRGGFNITTDPEKIWKNSKGEEVTAANFDTSMQLTRFSYKKAPMQSLSAGFGYSSPGSFFADLAARVTKYPVADYYPYYYEDYTAYDKNGAVLKDAAGPYEPISRKLWSVALTIGWRF